MTGDTEFFSLPKKYADRKSSMVDVAPQDGSRKIDMQDGLSHFFQLFHHHRGRKVPITAWTRIDPEVDWKSYHQAKLISSETASALSVLRESGTFDSDPLKYSKAIFEVVKNVTNDEALNHILAMIDVLTQIAPTRAMYFLYCGKTAEEVLLPFTRLLNRLSPENRPRPEEDKIALLGTLITALISQMHPCKSTAISGFIEYLAVQLNSAKEASQSLTLKWLSVLLKKDYIRQLFFNAHGLYLLAPLLSANKRESVDIQMLYHVTFSLWLLSYNKEIAGHMDEGSILANLVEIVKTQPKEKVLRMALSTLRNLSGIKDFNTEMIEHGISKVLVTLEQRRFADEDIEEDLTALGESIEQDMTVLTSLAVFQKEVSSGKLDWGPVHNEAFWRENALKFDANEFQLLKALVRLLQQTTDERVMSVACFDLGEFARFHPRGKTILQQLGAKSLVMGLMENPNEEVQKHSLASVSKMMVHNWEYLPVNS